MNYLAHLYLSSSKNILIGNFIADAVKGKSYLNFPDEIQKGILLHRKIDTFTDEHTIVRTSKKRLDKQYNHYKGVIIDIFYDHFLAKNWNNYSNIPLEIFAMEIYSFLNLNKEIYPVRIQKLLQNMITYNWLESYKSLEGIEKVLNGMNYRTNGISKMNLAINDLNLHYQEFENDFTLFFNDLIQYNKQKTSFLLSQ